MLANEILFVYSNNISLYSIKTHVIKYYEQSDRNIKIAVVYQNMRLEL